MCIFGIKKKPLNESDDNYYRGGGHNPLFEDSPSECGGGAATVRCGLISKWHSRNKIQLQGRVTRYHWLKPNLMPTL